MHCCWQALRASRHVCANSTHLGDCMLTLMQKHHAVAHAFWDVLNLCNAHASPHMLSSVFNGPPASLVLQLLNEPLSWLAELSEVGGSPIGTAVLDVQSGATLWSTQQSIPALPIWRPDGAALLYFASRAAACPCLYEPAWTCMRACTSIVQRYRSAQMNCICSQTPS